MQMKGNNGRAARKVLIRRLSMVLISFLVCIGCLHLMGIGRSAKGPMTLKRLHHDISTSLNMQNANALRENLRSRADLLSKSMFRDFGNKQQQQQQQRPTLTVPQPQQRRSRHTDGPQIIDFTFDDNSDPVGLQLLLEAQVHLVDIDISDPKAVVGDFCTLNFAAHKADPSLVPMFRHLVQASPECDKVRYRVLLNDYVRHATEHDAKSDAKSKSLNLTAVVFHESRCGSTLVSNALIAMNPAKHRVYSESAPPIAALLSMCGETFKGCTLHQASRVLKDVMYAMGRTNDPNEERVFFKIQSIGTRTLKVFQHAFPNVPFMFVYREPVQVMMSQLKQGTKNANCVRPRMRPPPSVVDVCAKKGLAVGELSDEEYCAAHLASITEAALAGMHQGPGTPINYVDLPAILWEVVLPSIGVPVSVEEIAAMVKISTQYSKGGDGRSAEFHEDSEKKEKMASQAVKEASAMFLQESYDALQAFKLK